MDMSHVTLKEVLVDARKRHYAVPCLGGINLEAIIGIVKERIIVCLIASYCINEWTWFQVGIQHNIINFCTILCIVIMYCSNETQDL